MIGRGDVKLKDLPHNLSDEWEATILIIKLEISPSQNCLMEAHCFYSNILIFDQPMAHDLKIVISNVNLTKTGKYIFKASYTTSKPEMLTSAGTDSKHTLTVTRTIADLERIVDKEPHYKETPIPIQKPILNGAL